MNRQYFEIGMDTWFDISEEAEDAIIDKSISSCTKEQKLVVAMEELAECTQVISKLYREEGDLIPLIEEIADVKLALEMVTRIVGITDDQLKQSFNIKLNRERRRRVAPKDPIKLEVKEVIQPVKERRVYL